MFKDKSITLPKSILQKMEVRQKNRVAKKPKKDQKKD